MPVAVSPAVRPADFRDALLRLPSKRPQKGRQAVRDISGEDLWAGKDADFDRAVAFTPAAFLWQREKAYLVELPALWARIPLAGRDPDELAGEAAAALAAEGCPAPHLVIGGDGHVVVVWAIQPLRRPGKTKPEAQHFAFRRTLESWRRAALKLSFVLEPLGCRPLDVALADELLTDFIPLPFVDESPLFAALGLHDEPPRVIRSEEINPIVIADVSIPLKRFDARMFATLGVGRPHSKKQWLKSATSLAALEPKGPGTRHPAAVQIACAAVWDGEAYDQVVARLRAWAGTCAQDGSFPFYRGKGDELELIAAWAVAKLKPGGPDRVRARPNPEDKRTTRDDVAEAVRAFLAAAGGTWAGAKHELAKQVALWRVEGGSAGLCPLTTLKRVLAGLKDAGDLIHDVLHDGRTWRSTWRSKQIPVEIEGTGTISDPRGQKGESTWAPGLHSLALTISEGVAGERLLPAGGVQRGAEVTISSSTPNPETQAPEVQPLPVSLSMPENDHPPRQRHHPRLRPDGTRRRRREPEPEQFSDFSDPSSASLPDIPGPEARPGAAAPANDQPARQRRLPLPRLRPDGTPRRRHRRHGTEGTGLPELTPDLIDQLSDVAPLLTRQQRIELLAEARSRLRPRPKVLADFAGALRRRASRLHHRNVLAAMEPMSVAQEEAALQRHAEQEQGSVVPETEPGLDIAALFAAARLPFDQRSVFDRAQRLHSDGLHLVPLAPGSKEPATTWSEWQRRQMPLTLLRRHLEALGPDAGLAIICGEASGVVVADLDDEGAVAWAKENLPSTPWVTRTSRGEHWFYRYPSTPLLPTVPPWTGQLQADGRYVVAPGSLHPDGGRYECAGDWTRTKDTLPVFDPRWLVHTADLRAARAKILKT